MNKWRINRLKIHGFKVFTSFEEKYNNALIIYDGPNGFGKTSLFDAKQLLFRGQLPRIAARLKPVTPNKHSFKSNLYRHNGYTGDIRIIAELTNGSQTINIMRKADAKDMKAKMNKPSEFSIFKLYQSEKFDDWSSAVEVLDENAFWKQYLGANFQKNFDVLNYLQQDSKALIIPDGCCEDTTRTKQIEHLINLDELNARLDNIQNLKHARKKAYDHEIKVRDSLKVEVAQLKQQLSTPGQSIEYFRLTTNELVPVWDSETPLTAERLNDYPNHLVSVNLLKTLVEHSDEVAIRERNRKKSAFLKTEEFVLTVRLASHIDKLKSLRDLREQRKPLEKMIMVAKKNATELKEIDLPVLKQSLADGFDDFSELVKQKEQLQTYQSTIGDTKTKTLELRNRLKTTISENESNCPLCGFDYNDHQLLIDAIDVKTKKIENELDLNGKKITDCLRKIDSTLQILLRSLQNQLEKIDKKFNPKLLQDIEAHEHQINRLLAISNRVRQLNISLPEEYAETAEQQNEQVEDIRQKILLTFEPESDSLPEQALAMFYSAFKNHEELKEITFESVEKKLNYIHNEYSNLVSKTHEQKLKAFNQSESRLTAISKVEDKLRNTEKQLNQARNNYINQTLGEIELLFHIYSGRLLQNMQTGLGIFLERADGTQKDTPLQFKTARGDEHDAVLSMSSGQISALALSLFLALNKKYAETAFVFIDDPTQCMDEINIASLSDLLRVELRDRQVIMSTHEQDIANYLIYRYSKAGLSHQKINLLQKHRDVLTN
ncbi:AAA family ATPase [Vibrio parahaemolyticus]|nr:AAA family ATPase [Vibrio parahaemolyticus]EIK0771677.1 AAA family ATPase [Vibrio alginolyticus]